MTNIPPGAEGLKVPTDPPDGGVHVAPHAADQRGDADHRHHPLDDPDGGAETRSEQSERKDSQSDWSWRTQGGSQRICVVVGGTFSPSPSGFSPGSLSCGVN